MCVMFIPTGLRCPRRALRDTESSLDPCTARISYPSLGASADKQQGTACIEALRAIPFSKPIRIITDSKYVYDGVTTYMHWWALQGLQVTDQDLWDWLRSLLRTRTAQTLWKHVYSHVGVPGNDLADALANLGRQQHPARLQLLRDLQRQRGLASVVLPS